MKNEPANAALPYHTSRYKNADRNILICRGPPVIEFAAIGQNCSNISMRFLVSGCVLNSELKKFIMPGAKCCG